MRLPSLTRPESPASIARMPVTKPTREHLAWAYRLFLDREPANELVIENLLGVFESMEELRNSFLWSREFRTRNPEFPSPPMPTEDDLGPLPPPNLIELVAGSSDPYWFRAGGRRAAESLSAILKTAGNPLGNLSSVLDFGCGCGRVIRHIAPLGFRRLAGVDYNPSLVEWCAGHIPSANFAVNGAAPPLPFETGTFDLVYAFSVFTHLTEEFQKSWLAEIHRVLDARGLLVVSTMGDAYRGELTDELRDRYDRGELVVREADSAGSNLCGAFHPEAYFRSMADSQGFQVRSFIPQGAEGNPNQDLWLLEKVGTAPRGDERFK
jgi:SAM-dependent methyltransferase